MPPHPGKALILFGVLLVAAGALWLAAGKIPLLGKLPGDLRIERGNLTIFLPFGTCLLLSLAGTLLLWLLRR